ncbi:MAG TPA: histidine kinase [Bryobacteraceae bacterium]|nr:histidine kinase [Bryobacteraceae bacterium]
MSENVGSPDGLTCKLIEALSLKQDELNRVAQVLHEDVGQVLTVVGLQLDVLRQDFVEQSPAIATRTVEIQQLLEKAVGDVRTLSYQLNPGMVPRSGLRYALDTLVGRMRERCNGATIRFLMDSHVHLPLPAAVAVYDITEHALGNAVSHSGATLIEVVLQPLVALVRLEVRDNGRGFDQTQVEAFRPGLGILCMRHTALKSGLTFHIETGYGKGTVIRAVYREETPEGATRHAV